MNSELFKIALHNRNSLLGIENERNKDNFDDVLSKMFFLLSLLYMLSL